jgi:site-specific DNA recombinase
METKKRASLYLRVSTLEQAVSERTSLETQRERGIALAVSKGFLPPRDEDIYTDASSGFSLDERPALEKLRNKIKNKLVDAVIVWKIDRLARNTLDSLTIAKEFKDNGVGIYSVVDSIDTSSKEGDIYFKFLSIFAEMEREAIRERMMSGRYAKTSRDGTNFGAEAPFGYKTENKKFIIIEEEARIISSIYELYLQLKSVQKVARVLKDSGTSARINLDDKQVRRILRNPKYRGQHKVKDKIYPGSHEPIISSDIYDRVQDLLNNNFQKHKKMGKVAPGFILRDVAICGHCGRQMVQIQTQSTIQGKRLLYYGCALRRKRKNRNPKNNCVHKVGHKKFEFEEEAIDTISHHINESMKNEDYLLRHIYTTSRQEVDRIKGQIQTQERSLDSRKKAKERALKLFTLTGDSDAEILFRNSIGEIREIEDRIKRLRVDLEKAKSSREDLKEKKSFYENFMDNLKEADDEEKRDLINSVVSSLKSYNSGKIEIEYAF